MPRLVRLGKVEISFKGQVDFFALCKFLAIVGGQGQHRGFVNTKTFFEFGCDVDRLLVGELG